MLGTISPHAIDGSPEAVRALHALTHRRLRRQIDLHKEHISPDGWARFTRVAFALYVDSREATGRERRASSASAASRHSPDTLSAREGADRLIRP